MIKVWALILNGLVVNTVLASDQDIKDPAYVWIDITNLNPQPCIGWSYDGNNFIPPEVSDG